MKRSLKILLALALVLALVLGNALPVLADGDVNRPVRVQDGVVYVYDEQTDMWVENEELSESLKLNGTLDSDVYYRQGEDADIIPVLEVTAESFWDSSDGPSHTEDTSFTVTGDVKAAGADKAVAVVVEADYGCSAELTVEGKVSATAENEDGMALAAEVSSWGKDGSAELTIGKGAEGSVGVMAADGSTATLTIQEGGITAENPVGMYGPPAAVTSMNQNATMEIDITGDVETNGYAGVFSQTMAGGNSGSAGESDSAKTTIIIDGSLSLSSDSIPVGYGIVLSGDGEGSETDLTMTGDLTVDGGFEASGLVLDAEDGAVINATLTGDITADSQYASRGVHLSAADSAGINAALTGDITADGQYQTAGLEVEADYNAVITATLTGDISVSSGEDGYCDAIAISNEASTVNVLVTGNVTATGESSAGAYVEAESYYYYEGEESDIDMSQEYTGEDELEEDSKLVCGECEYDLYTVGKGDEKKYYAEVYSEEDEKWHYFLVTSLGEPLPDPDTDPATSGLVIVGDVTADAVGVMLDANKCSTVDVVVDGTVEGGKGSLVLINDTQLGDGVTLTVWEVKPNADGALISDMEFDPESEGENYSLTQNKKAEAQLQYIIRVNAEQTDMITAGGAAQEYSAQGKTWKVAHEGETVTLLLQNIPEGYEITAAYGDVSQNLKLEKDKDGNYFLTVPRGGAVELSIVLSKLPDPEPDPEPEADTVMITYILGNGTDNDHIRTTAAIGEGVALQPAPEREGYTFLYWQCTDVDPNSSYYKQPDPDNDFQFRPGAIYTAKKDINFVAVWQKN